MNGRRIAKLVHEGTVPARNGELLLGTWQEIYPREHPHGSAGAEGCGYGRWLRPKPPASWRRIIVSVYEIDWSDLNAGPLACRPL